MVSLFSDLVSRLSPPSRLLLSSISPVSSTSSPSNLPPLSSSAFAVSSLPFRAHSLPFYILGLFFLSIGLLASNALPPAVSNPVSTSLSPPSPLPPASHLLHVPNHPPPLHHQQQQQQVGFLHDSHGVPSTYPMQMYSPSVPAFLHPSQIPGVSAHHLPHHFYSHAPPHPQQQQMQQQMQYPSPHPPHIHTNHGLVANINNNEIQRHHDGSDAVLYHQQQQLQLQQQIQHQIQQQQQQQNNSSSATDSVVMQPPISQPESIGVLSSSPAFVDDSSVASTTIGGDETLTNVSSPQFASLSAQSTSYVLTSNAASNTIMTTNPEIDVTQ
eukprot:GDKK01046502.1.p1 GENE.GDKK01046502.1~~GDKK01046502.1.p1  ORF type:complete len:327 (-),score=101.14 GDKK01046502.1:203-1183(-)